jgi:phosphatidylserine/phosphatidylglycerophosphate/cardiolipin synthase-like enzyme
MDEAGDLYDQQMRAYMGGQPPGRRRAARLAEFAKEYAFTAKPYQDVSLRVRGPVLCDLNHNFCYGWAEAKVATSTLMNALWMTPPGLMVKAALAVARAVDKTPESVPALVQSRKHIKAADFILRGGQHSAQLMRTYPAHKEKSIKECYANLTRLTEHYIFSPATAEARSGCSYFFEAAARFSQKVAFLMPSLTGSKVIGPPAFNWAS